MTAMSQYSQDTEGGGGACGQSASYCVEKRIRCRSDGSPRTQFTSNNTTGNATDHVTLQLLLALPGFSCGRTQMAYQ